MSIWLALLFSVLLLWAGAFFVAAEFALVASGRHRLEVLAPDSYRARAALRGSRELALMLAGAQLGITMTSLGLGAVAEPALVHLIEPVLESAGLPVNLSYLIAVLVGLAVVVFLHIVVGEMAPKSLAITHPERAALVLAVPFRAFTWLTRPALRLLNGIANATLRVVGVQPTMDLAVAHGPDDLRLLVEHSAERGLLDEAHRRMLRGALSLSATPLRGLVSPGKGLAGVSADAGLDTVEQTARESGHARLLVLGEGAEPVGVVHVRDALTAVQREGVTAGDIARRPLRLSGGTPIYQGFRIMQDLRTHLALIVEDGRPVGIVTLQDVLDELLDGAVAAAGGHDPHGPDGPNGPDSSIGGPPSQ